MRNVLPDLAGDPLEAVKLTSRVSVVAVPDLFRMARVALDVHFHTSPLVLAALLYAALLWRPVWLIRRFTVARCRQREGLSPPARIRSIESARSRPDARESPR